MPTLSPEPLIAALQSMSPTLLTLLVAVACYMSIVLALRLFGAAGLFVYISVAVIAANVQVLKPAIFIDWVDPVALGTVMFASTYLATDVLTEVYGPQVARRAVWCGFAAFLFWTVSMILTLGYAPLTPEQAGEGLAWALPAHDAMAFLFTPAPAIFAASMISYLTSQYTDVWLYQAIRRLTGDQRLWLRNNVSTMISGLLDNAIFSTLAFVVFTPEPIDFGTLVWTFILGTYALRLALAAFDTPFMYLARRIAPMSRRTHGAFD